MAIGDVTYGPNLRHELAVLLHGDHWDPLGNGMFGGYGHWIVYYWAMRNEKSPRYSKDWKESVGDDVYQYRKFLLKTRRLSSAMAEAEKLVEPGIMDKNSYLYYVEHFIPVQLDDIIWEIDKNIGPHPPAPPFVAREKMKITRIEPVLGNEGRVEYNIVIATSASKEW
jgi:hypothetical protein